MDMNGEWTVGREISTTPTQFFAAAGTKSVSLQGPKCEAELVMNIDV